MSPIIHYETSLQALNTFNVNVKTEQFASIDSADTLQEILQHKARKADLPPEKPCFVLGSGSNILFTEDYPGLILKNNIQGFSLIADNKHYVDISLGAGENWHQIVLKTLSLGWYGLENLALIPGTVGAAPVQNIGAYGVELDSKLVSVSFIDLKTRQRHVLTNDECQFSYRDSIFKRELKGKVLITHVNLRLNKQPDLQLSYGSILETLNAMKVKSPMPLDVAHAVMQIRQSKLPDPSAIPNAGSFFKNPIISQEVFESLQQHYPQLSHHRMDEQQIKIPAAWLIEQCGWKGYRNERIGVHDTQALVLINHHNGSGMDICRLADQITYSVLETFNIKLEKEVTII